MSVFLVACGQATPPATSVTKTLDGRYFSPTLDRSLTFKPDGMVYETSGKNIFAGDPYTIEEGGKIKVAGADVYQLRLVANGTIESVYYGVMVKK